jgi:microcystin-dependent protein
MKKIILLSSLFAMMQASFAQVGVGTSSPHASSQLDVSSTVKGFLPPRMTAVQRGNISSPAAGLMVFQTDGTSGLYFYNGSSWVYVINAGTATLPVSAGGTGVTTLSSNALITGNGTSAVGTIAPGTSGKILYSNGTNWLAGSTTVGNTGSGTAISVLQPYSVITYGIATYGLYPSFSGADPYMGEIYTFAYGDGRVPSGYMKCDGSTLSIGSYAALFSLLGTAYGGNGTTTFGLPDLRGRIPLGAGRIDGLGTTYSPGGKSGAESVSLTTGNMPSHNHTITYN